LNLPDIAGAKVLEILKADEQTKNLPITVVSADATTKQMEYILSKGADQYLTKPIDIRQLIKIFDLYLKKTFYDQ
jgi:CheY-like chemotaxis protein